MKKIKNMLLIAVLLTASALTTTVTAQVTIGANTPPQSFSALELISGGDKGMRLPQMSNTDKTAAFGADNAVLTAAGTAAQGLQVFNTDTQCVETWNGAEWISQCMNCDGITFPALSGSYSLCNGAKISDLTATVGGNVAWYDALTGGNKRADADALPINTTTTYYAEQSVGSCKNAPRTAVSVTVGNCSVAVGGAGITTFTNVMYDFQKQTLEAYPIGGAVATTYLWEYSTDGGTWNTVPNPVNSNKYVVSPHFADTYFAGAHSKSILFRCTLSNPATSPAKQTSNLNILFINTNNLTGGYGEQGGVKYLTLRSRNTSGTGAWSTLKVALTNLGSDDDADDLGDFYQWGRIADGHEHTVWSKDAAHANQILPFGSGGTSAVLTRPATTSNGNNPAWNNEIGSNFDQITDGGEVGKYLSNSSNWSSTTSNYRWGQSTQSNTQRNPAKTANDPCPSGWRVPSRWQYSDLNDNNGTTAPNSATNNYTSTNNAWVWRDSSNGAVGGALITNAAGEILFLPVSGIRESNGTLNLAGDYGFYWSSTYVDASNAYNLVFFSGYLNTCNDNRGSRGRAEGLNVRCVME